MALAGVELETLVSDTDALTLYCPAAGVLHQNHGCQVLIACRFSQVCGNATASMTSFFSKPFFLKNPGHATAMKHYKKKLQNQQCNKNHFKFNKSKFK